MVCIVLYHARKASGKLRSQCPHMCLYQDTAASLHCVLCFITVCRLGRLQGSWDGQCFHRCFSRRGRWACLLGRLGLTGMPAVSSKLAAVSACFLQAGSCVCVFPARWQLCLRVSCMFAAVSACFLQDGSAVCMFPACLQLCLHVCRAVCMFPACLQLCLHVSCEMAAVPACLQR
jgi:hypothetical protein